MAFSTPYLSRMMFVVFTTLTEAWETVRSESGVTRHAGFVEFEEIEIDDIRILLLSRMCEHTCMLVK